MSRARSMAPYQNNGDLFGSMMAHHSKIGQHMDQLASEMMSGFGMRDPFANDPFFAGARSGFGNIDQMMADMQGRMAQDMSQGLSGGSRFQSMQSQQTTKLGPDGRPVKESFKVSTKGAVGPNGKRVTERQQMYENEASGAQKMAHERMLDGRGRKMVQQRVGANSHQQDIFRNMDQNGVQQFDEEWNRMADQMGLNYKGNRLGYAGNDRQQNYAHQNQGYQDDSRRGHFLPMNARAQDAPVRMSSNALGSSAALRPPPERTHDLRPTQPMPRSNAIPMGGPPAQQNTRTRDAPVPIAGAAQRRQPQGRMTQPRAYQAPAAKSSKPARAG